MEDPFDPARCSDASGEEFALATVRMWKHEGRLQMRLLTRVGLEPGDEHTSSVATTEIDEAVALVHSFITEFAAST